jgi:hypothetical protein
MRATTGSLTLRDTFSPKARSEYFKTHRAKQAITWAVAWAPSAWSLLQGAILEAAAGMIWAALGLTLVPWVLAKLDKPSLGRGTADGDADGDA